MPCLCAPCIAPRGMPQYQVEKPVENGRPKKKRWSLGGLFKRKSKKDSESSSEDENKRGFLRRKKERGSKDVTGLFVVQTGRSVETGRKRVKAKVEASRELLESSSGEEGSFSSGVGGSLNRKSRAARTERYLRRKCEAWSPSPTRRMGERSVSEQGMRQVGLYVPPPPPTRPPPPPAHRALSEQFLPPRPSPDPGPRRPPTPPERRSSRHLDKRRSGHLEDALDELEAVYRSLRLGEEEDRPPSTEHVRDDMALRRWTRRDSATADTRRILGQAGSYLLLSPSLSPPPPYPGPPDEPNVTLDDVVFRSVQHTNNTLRVADPQPPFGIPLSPVSPAPKTDYLHASPRLTRRGSPDIVLDDLAFRNLRKDQPKRKAARSMSANLSSLVRPREINNNADHDVPKELRLAQRMLDIRLMNLRNKIKDQEARRAPQRARYGSDGQSRYSDLHPVAHPDRRVVLRDDWRRPPTPEKLAPSKEDLRKKFFADAYRNLEPKPHLKENQHHRVRPPRAEKTTTTLDDLFQAYSNMDRRPDKERQVRKDSRQDVRKDVLVPGKVQTRMRSPQRSQTVMVAHTQERPEVFKSWSQDRPDKAMDLPPLPRSPHREAPDGKASVQTVEEAEASSRRVAALLRELTRSLDCDFGEETLEPDIRRKEEPLVEKLKRQSPVCLDVDRSSESVQSARCSTERLPQSDPAKRHTDNTSHHRPSESVQSIKSSAERLPQPEPAKRHIERSHNRSSESVKEVRRTESPQSRTGSQSRSVESPKRSTETQTRSAESPKRSAESPKSRSAESPKSRSPSRSASSPKRSAESPKSRRSSESPRRRPSLSPRGSEAVACEEFRPVAACRSMVPAKLESSKPEGCQ